MPSRLFVSNLPRSATDQTLRDFVAGVGFQIASANVIRDKITGLPSGFGYVELAAGEDCERALIVLNGQSLSGRTLVVNEAHPRSTDTDQPQGCRQTGYLMP